ncbi:MAG: exonuclease domain-containing protein [Candidatus Ornithomonoglobus sp.]
MQILKYFLDNYDSIIFFDVETTGLDFRDDEVIEFACIDIKRSGRAKCHDFLVNVHFRLPREIVKLTHITDEMLADEGIERRQLARFIDEELFNKQRILLLAHNANFDMNFIKYLFQKEGRKIPWNKIDIIDTLTILRDRKEYPHRLENAISFYGLDGIVENSHRAIDDVKAMLMVFDRMSHDNGDVVKYINLFGYNPKYGIRETVKLPRVKYEAQRYGERMKLYEWFE